MMTERLQPLPTQLAIPSQTLSPADPSASSHDVARQVETGEEEPYTIRCICDFAGDDGNTIYCDTCDTWQHIECFYPDNREEAVQKDFAHACNVCKPRPLDRPRALERTRQLRATLGEPIDKKPQKRPPSKSHKKKPKPTDLQLGNHVAPEITKNGSPNDQPPPAKKPKHAHKPSQSSSSHPAKRSPSYGTSKPQVNGTQVNGTQLNGTQLNGHPPSPATTPPDLPAGFEIHTYAEGFLALCGESDVKTVDYNSFVTLSTSNTVSLWLTEPKRMLADTGMEFDDVFQAMPADINSRNKRPVVEEKDLQLTPDIFLKWRYLTTRDAIPTNVPLIELNGPIGVQLDYCSDAANRWDELTSPLPFVFFHPQLPLYIDTRKEGSDARYVRRSCKPNAIFETYVSATNDIHIWLVSDRHITAGEQITLPWDFRLPKQAKDRMLRFVGLGDDEIAGKDEPDMDESEYNSLTDCFYRVLSEYGGCACDLGNDCAFARFHRRYHAKQLSQAQAPTPLPSKKRSRKPKQGHTMSPTSTGHATNSRAASEGHADEVADDGRSTSGSSHSKPPSRDMTPAPRQGSFDTFTGILTGPTSRDKRKVAMLEDQFRALEQPKPKKKRVSDGATSNKSKSSKTTSTSRPAGNGTSTYVDAGTTLRSKSGSPSSATSPVAAIAFREAASRQASVEAASPLQPTNHARSTYRDASVQTDHAGWRWLNNGCRPLTKSRSLAGLGRKLLSNRRQQRLGEEERRRSLPSSVAQDSTTPMDVDSVAGEPRTVPTSPTEVEKPPPSAPIGLATTIDTTMADAPSTSPTISRPPSASLATPTSALTSPVKIRSPELRVQMPPVPSFGGSGLGISTATTPLSANGSIVQSPFSTNLPSPFASATLNNVIAQSPMKKKLSFSDYKRFKGDKTAASKTGATKLSTFTSDSANLDSIVDSPTGEKAAEGVNGSTAVTTGSV